MKINEDIIKGKWLEIKGEVQKAWGKLTADELDQTKGDIKAIAGLVQQKYGENQENFEKRLNKILREFEKEKPASGAKVKGSQKH